MNGTLVLSRFADGTCRPVRRVPNGSSTWSIAQIRPLSTDRDSQFQLPPPSRLIPKHILSDLPMPPAQPRDWILSPRRHAASSN